MNLSLDPRDIAIQNSLPLVMAPRFGALAPVAVGSKRLIAAADGIYLEVRSPALHACVPIHALDAPLPYGRAEAFVKLAAGAVPAELLYDAIDRAVEACPNETALAITLDPTATGYAITEVPIDAASPVSVRYTDALDDDALVFDIHSHGHGVAQFSSVDDTSDCSRRGPYIALVLGTCSHHHTTTLSARFCCSPYLVPLSVDALQPMGVLA